MLTVNACVNLQLAIYGVIFNVEMYLLISNVE